MSRSNPTAKNPATRFFKWKGGAGALAYYDKEAQEEITVPFNEEKPFVFLVLDELNTISGFSDRDKSSFWSNEVRDLKTGVLTVRTSAGVKAQGVYSSSEIDHVKTQGAKYAKSVYIAYKDDTDELVIGHLMLTGAALTAWIEFQKQYDVYKVAVALEGSKSAKKGATKYFIPVFDGRNVQESTNREALKLDAELQSYLGTYLARPQNEEVVDEADDNDEDEVEDSEPDTAAETPEPQAAEAPAPKKKAAPTEPAKEKINLKDVPF